MEAWLCEVSNIARHEIVVGRNELITVLTASLEVNEPPIIPCSPNTDGSVTPSQDERRIIGSSISRAEPQWVLTGQVTSPLVSADGYASSMPRVILGVFRLHEQTSGDVQRDASSFSQHNREHSKVTPKKRFREAPTGNSESVSTVAERRLCGVMQIRIVLRPESSLVLEVGALQAVHASAFLNAKLTLTGTVFRQHVAASYVPVIHHRWYTVKPNVRRCTYLPTRKAVAPEPAHADDPLPPPPHHLRAGETAEVAAISRCGEFVRWSDGREGPMNELDLYHRKFTPARADKIVRVRRYPHRNADILDTVNDKEVREAIGLAVDPVEHESYVHWRSGGWSRISGTGGPFLMEQRGIATIVFSPPKLFTSARDGKGVRIRQEPNLKAKEIGHMEPNEIREAIALHRDEEGNEFVEWKGPVEPGATAEAQTSATPQLHQQQLQSATATEHMTAGNNNASPQSGRRRKEVKSIVPKNGGFSCCRGLHGQFLVEIVPSNVPLRHTPLRGRKPPPSPDVLSLDRPTGSGNRRRPRQQEHDADSSDDDDDDISDIETYEKRQMRRKRRFDEPVDHGVSPALVPAQMKEDMVRGKLQMSALPKVKLGVDDTDDDSDEETDDDDDSDDDDEDSGDEDDVSASS